MEGFVFLLILSLSLVETYPNVELTNNLDVKIYYEIQYTAFGILCSRKIRGTLEPGEKMSHNRVACLLTE